MKNSNAVQFSEIAGRRKLWRLLCFLGWTEGLLGMGMSVMVLYPLQAITAIAPDNINFKVMYVSVFVAGLAVAVVALMGVLVSQASLYNPFLAASRRTYMIWYILGIIIVVFMTITVAVTSKVLKLAASELRDDVNRAMRSYLYDPTWKKILDKIHQEYRCCGMKSYEDWFMFNWIPPESLRFDYLAQKEFLVEVDGTLKTGVLPSSCCRPDIHFPCLHDAIQQNDSSPTWSSKDLPYQASVFTRGCEMPLLKSFLQDLGPFKIIATLVIIFQFGQLIIGKYLHSTIRNQSFDSYRSENINETDEDKACDLLLNKDNELTKNN